MTQNLNDLLLRITGELAAARSDIATLIQLQKEGADSRALQSDEIHTIDKRLTVLERDVRSIQEMVAKLDAARQTQSISAARIAALLTIAGVAVTAVVTVITAFIPQAVLEWWKSP
jgi:VIT1/CCC1 family predicted Fe2+/Mn2+ transporter